jgi:hypothetical protein
MKTAKRLFPVAALLSAAVFFALLGGRIGLFGGRGDVRALQPSDVIEDDAWMSIRQKSNPIGYAHRRLTPSKTGYRMEDTTHMRINTMGMVQDLYLKTRADLRSDLSMVSFDFSLRSNVVDFEARGSVEGGELIVTMDGKTHRIPLEDDIYLTGGVLDAAAGSGLSVGESRTFSVFDPTTLGRRSVRVTAEAEEELHLGETSHKTTRLAVDFMGSRQTAWVDEEGRVLREEGLMGITMTRTSQEEALSEMRFSPSEDLTREAAVPVDTPIRDPVSLSRLTLEVTGIDDFLNMDGERQRLNGRRLTVAREPVPDPAEVGVPDDFRVYLSPTPFIEADDPAVEAVVEEVVSPQDAPLERVRKLTAWVYDNIEKRPVLSVPSAAATLRSRAGDCNEHAVLLAALARAAGIPTRIEAGLVLLDDRFFYHAWNAVYLDGWVTVDALLNQIPADVTHIRFVHGEPQQQVDLMGVIGRVRLKVIEQS